MLAHWSLRARVYALANMWFRGTHLQWPEPSTLNIQPTNLTKALPKPPTPQYKGHTMIYRYKAGSDSEAAYIVPLLIFKAPKAILRMVSWDLAVHMEPLSITLRVRVPM